MREVTFLKKNAEKWKQVEAFLTSKEKVNPDKLAELFIELTDDLSYTRTFYPQSKTTQYLNSLTAKVHQSIYKTKKNDLFNSGNTNHHYFFINTEKKF